MDMNIPRTNGSPKYKRHAPTRNLINYIIYIPLRFMGDKVSGFMGLMDVEARELVGR
jgi:hypothetical protein